MRDRFGIVGDVLATAAAALIAAMLIAPIVHRINVALSCSFGTPAPVAAARLQAPPAPKCDEARHLEAGTSLRARQ